MYLINPADGGTGRSAVPPLGIINSSPRKYAVSLTVRLFVVMSPEEPSRTMPPDPPTVIVPLTDRLPLVCISPPKDAHDVPESPIPCKKNSCSVSGSIVAGTSCL